MAEWEGERFVKYSTTFVDRLVVTAAGVSGNGHMDAGGIGLVCWLRRAEIDVHEGDARVAR